MISAVVIACAAGTGVWAYFTDLKRITVSVKTSTAGIVVDKTVFERPVAMVPGDSHRFTYQIRNENPRAMKVKSELVLKSEQAITDEVEWYISDNQNGTFELPAEGQEVTLADGQRVKYESMSADRKQVVFSIDSGVLDGTEEQVNAERKQKDDIAFYLILAKNANNDFQNTTCDLSADIYAIQHKNTDDLNLNINDNNNWGYVKSIVSAQSPNGG